MICKFLILSLSLISATINNSFQGNCGDLYYKKITSSRQTKYLVLNISNFSKNGDTIVLKNNKDVRIDVFSVKEHQPNYCSDIVIIDDNIQVENLYCENGTLVINRTIDSIKIELFRGVFKNSKNKIIIKNETIKTKLNPNNG